MPTRRIWKDKGLSRLCIDTAEICSISEGVLDRKGHLVLNMSKLERQDPRADKGLN